MQTRRRSRPTSEPTYHRLAGLLEAMIQTKSLRPGDKMPSVRQFSRQQRVSIPTALHAYVTLENRGLLEARPKSGFFVRARQADVLRAPTITCRSPKVTDFAALDPMESIMAAHANPSLVPLGAALPNAQLLPGIKLAREIASVARRLGPKGSSYDVAPGAEVLRAEIARRSLEWGCALQADDFILTNGCTEAVALALQVLCNPGDTVAVESPTYFGLARMLRELKLKALPIRVDSEKGIDLEALETALKRTRVSAVALIPNFHNPVGFVMPEERKRELLTLAGFHGVPIIEDDIYGELQHSGPRPRCLKAFDADGSVILCSSFSKTLAPGYRIGYVSGGKWHKQILRLKMTTSLANATLPALAIAQYLKNGGYDRFLRSIRQTYRNQVAQMRELVAQHFPPGIGLSHPQGSFVLWCEFASNIDSIELFNRASKAGISIAPGPLFSADGGFRNCIRLNCGHPVEKPIREAVATLGKIARQVA